MPAMRARRAAWRPVQQPVQQPRAGRNAKAPAERRKVKGARLGPSGEVVR